jgi:membrane protease YdiL (CAAX protease family)
MFTSASGRVRPIWSFLLSVAFSAAAFVVCTFVAGALTGDHTLRFEVIFRPLLAAVLFGVYVWLLAIADQVEEHRAATMGFPIVKGWLRQFAAGCLLGFVLPIIALTSVAIWGTTTIDVRLNSHTLALVPVILVVLISGALAEELMFRGYPFQRLEEAIGPFGAIAVFSVLFGAVHLTNPGASALGLLNTVLIGIVLAIAYLRTRALWLPLGLHFGWNATLGLIFGLPVSGLRIFNVVTRASASGPRWLTGGSYGIEASAPGVLAIVVGLLVVWKWPGKRLAEPFTSPRPDSDNFGHLPDV